MKKLGKNQWIAVAVSLGLLTFILFTTPIMNLFNSQTGKDKSVTVPQTGFVINDIVVGSGEVASVGDTLTVHYIGTLLDGKVFDSSIDRNTPFTFILGAGEVIRGWDEGFSGMHVGGKRVLIIAPDYAYGDSSAGGIPPQSTLIFEVELLDVEKDPSSR